MGWGYQDGYAEGAAGGRRISKSEMLRFAQHDKKMWGGAAHQFLGNERLVKLFHFSRSQAPAWEWENNFSDLGAAFFDLLQMVHQVGESY
jgi:hypothetical protein